MSIITKKNLLTTILVVLIIINIVALGTFFFGPHHSFDKRDAGKAQIAVTGNDENKS